MNINASDLLRLLGSGVRPEGVAGGAASTPIEGQEFSALLSKAEKSELESGRPVQVARDAGVTLSESQLARLAKLADAAEAAGGVRLLALIDEQAVVIDLATRTVERGLDKKGAAASADVLLGVDSAAVAPADPASDVQGSLERLPLPVGAIRLPGTLGSVANSALLSLLSGRSKAG